jgi:hypothetical protein
MKNKLILILLLCLSILPIVLATEQIENSTFTIKIYNNTIEIISSEYSGNNKNFTFSITNVTGNNTYYLAVTPVIFNYDFVFVKNATVEIGLVDKYTTCLTNMADNLTALNNNLTNCQLLSSGKDGTITSLNTQIADLQTKEKDTENTKYLFGLLGGVLSILGYAWYKGDLKKKKYPGPAEEFNPVRNR